MTDYEYEELNELKKIRQQQEWDSNKLPASLVSILFTFVGLPLIVWIIIKVMIGAWH